MSDKEYSVIKNGVKSLTRIAKNKLTGVDDKVPENIAKQRLAKCLTCPHLQKPFQQCGVCKCFVQSKVTFKEESCPEDKWSSYEEP